MNFDGEKGVAQQINFSFCFTVCVATDVHEPADQPVARAVHVTSYFSVGNLQCM